MGQKDGRKHEGETQREREREDDLGCNLPARGLSATRITRESTRRGIAPVITIDPQLSNYKRRRLTFRDRKREREREYPIGTSTNEPNIVRSFFRDASG